MAKQLLVLDEVLAMMGVVGISQTKIAAFKQQAETVLEKRDDTGYDNITVTSGYGTRSQQGFVTLTMNKERSQMEITKAREIANMLRDAAAAAESDAAIVRLLRERVGLNDEARIGQILLDLREMRQGTRGISRPS